MAKYSAYVLVSTASPGGGPSRVFFVKKEEDGSAFESEKLRELRIELAAKYGRDLIPVDLEVVDVEGLTAAVKKAIPKRRRT